MTGALSRRSEMLRTDAAYGLAILLREICEKAVLFTFSNDWVEVPPRRGFALRDALDASLPSSPPGNRKSSRWSYSRWGLKVGSDTHPLCWSQRSEWILLSYPSA
jgi:hypothetical protein